MEEWRDIPVSNGDYQISNKGRVKSVERVTKSGRPVHEKILKTRVNKNGYEYVCIQVSGKRLAIKIHREVAKAFVPNPKNYPQVNHKDEIKINNNADNLEWCTSKYNTNYGTGRARAALSKSKNHKLPINQYTVDGTFIKRWISPIAIERESDKRMRATNIIACCRKKFKTSYGYVWRYADPVQKVK